MWRERADLRPSHVHIRQLENPQFLMRMIWPGRANHA